MQKALIGPVQRFVILLISFDEMLKTYVYDCQILERRFDTEHVKVQKKGFYCLTAQSSVCKEKQKGA